MKVVHLAGWWDLWAVKRVDRTANLRAAQMGVARAVRTVDSWVVNWAASMVSCWVGRWAVRWVVWRAASRGETTAEY